jgi:putative flippase GtrA
MLKFSVVGAAGIAVQLGALTLLHSTRMHYLLATALAVECAVIHNFLWHRNFTWADRRRPGAKDFVRSSIRFHLSNGFVSLVGNLALMWILVTGCKIELLLANVISIAACFLGNFLASDRWVFRLP